MKVKCAAFDVEGMRTIEVRVDENGKVQVLSIDSDDKILCPVATDNYNEEDDVNMSEEQKALFQVVQKSQLKNVLALIGSSSTSWIKLDEIEWRKGVVSVYYDIDEGKLVFQEEDDSGCSIWDTKDLIIKHKEYD